MLFVKKLFASIAPVTYELQANDMQFFSSQVIDHARNADFIGSSLYAFDSILVPNLYQRTKCESPRVKIVRVTLTLRETDPRVRAAWLFHRNFPELGPSLAYIPRANDLEIRFRPLFSIPLKYLARDHPRLYPFASVALRQNQRVLEHTHWVYPSFFTEIQDVIR